MQDINFAEMPQTAIRVITSPVEFFRTMPKEGGYIEPLIFMMVMAVISGAVQSILALVGLYGTFSFFMSVSFLIMTPVMVLVLGFVGAAIMFVIWKLMGSQESYEVSYRCVAFVSVLMPLTIPLGIIPYVGTALGLVISFFYYVIATVEVHGIPARRAYMVFGIICALFVIVSIYGQFAAKKAEKEAARYKQEMEATKKQILEQAEAMKRVSEEAVRAMQRSAQETQQQAAGQQKTPEEAAREMQKAMEEMRKSMEKQKQDSK